MRLEILIILTLFGLTFVPTTCARPRDERNLDLSFLKYLKKDDNNIGQSTVTLPPKPKESTTKRVMRCVCDDDNKDAQNSVCGSNGITYNSQCRFECAKQRVSRLRKVKSGRCDQLSRNDFWNSKTN